MRHWPGRLTYICSISKYGSGSPLSGSKRRFWAIWLASPAQSKGNSCEWVSWRIWIGTEQVCLGKSLHILWRYELEGFLQIAQVQNLHCRKYWSKWPVVANTAYFNGRYVTAAVIFGRLTEICCNEFIGSGWVTQLYHHQMWNSANFDFWFLSGCAVSG